MGASNSRPVTSKFTDGEENDIIKYVAPSIQGWRAKMEDDRAAILDLDGSTSFFGVCDGHGGTDVAMYCASDFALKQNKTLPPAEQMVTCNPDICTVDITDDTEFLVIASDGIRNFICQHSIYVEIGAKKYAKEGAGGERRAANSNSESNEYEDISSPSSESDNKSKDPDYDPMEVDEVGNTRGGAESGDSSGNGSDENNNSSNGGKDDEDEDEGDEDEEEDEEEEQEDDSEGDYEKEEEETKESQKYWISNTDEFNELNPDYDILEINPLLPLMDKVSILLEGRRRGFYFIRDIAYDQADNYIKRHALEDDSSDDD